MRRRVFGLFAAVDIPAHARRPTTAWSVHGPRAAACYRASPSPSLSFVRHIQSRGGPAPPEKNEEEVIGVEATQPAPSQRGVYYIVPSLDVTPTGFCVPHLRGEVKLPLEANTDEVLRSLAEWLGLSGDLEPAQRLQGIREHLSTLPREEAEYRWPELDRPFPETVEGFFARTKELDELRAAIKKETPQFLPHVGWLRSRLEAAVKKAEEQERERPPAWWSAAARDAPAAPPYYRLTVQSEEEDHDGWCSEVESEKDLYSKPGPTETLFVPAVATTTTAWDFETKRLWIDGYAMNHCCCGARTFRRLISAELVE
jgi:hypothetical protein